MSTTQREARKQNGQVLHALRQMACVNGRDGHKCHVSVEDKQSHLRSQDQGGQQDNGNDCRGAHTFFLRQGQVARWGGYTVNLIHYEDAASLCVAVSSSFHVCVTGLVFLVH